MMCPHLGKAGLHRHLRGLVLKQALNLVCTVERGVTSVGQAPYHHGANILLGTQNTSQRVTEDSWSSGHMQDNQEHLQPVLAPNCSLAAQGEASPEAERTCHEQGDITATSLLRFTKISIHISLEI